MDLLSYLAVLIIGTIGLVLISHLALTNIGLKTPDRIRTETDDLLVLSEGWLFNFFIQAILFAFAAYLAYMALFTEEPWLKFWDEVGAGSVLLIALWLYAINFLISETVTVDKKSQAVTIQKNSPIKRFKSVRKIPFSDINRIYTELITHGNIDAPDYDPDVPDFWVVKLTTVRGEPTQIFSTRSLSDAEKVTDKIRMFKQKE